jgi:hypothetical protein
LEDPGGQGGKLQEEDNAIPKIENKEQCGRMTSGIYSLFGWLMAGAGLF